MSDDESYERAIAAEHRRLEAIFAEVMGALREGEPPDAIGDAFAALREAIEAHVDQEDQLYYPALRALRPEHRPAIERLIASHAQFRAHLAEVAALVAGGEVARVGAALEALLRGFAAHEVAEEGMLRALDTELGAVSTAG